MNNKVISISKRFETPAEEAAYQRGYSEGFEVCHHNLMRLMYVILSKHKDKSLVIMDEELTAIPADPKIVISSVANKGGRRWSIDEENN